MATSSRHHLLYDLVRWRRYRLVLAAAAVIGLGAELVLVANPATLQTGQYIGLVAILCLSLLVTFYMRMRLSYARVEGETLVVRVLFFRRRLGADDIKSCSLQTMATIAGRRQLPLGLRRWADVPALVVRIPDRDLASRIQRGIGGRFIWGQDLVLPVQAARPLCDSVRQDVLGQRPLPLPGTGTRQRRRRNRKLAR